MKYKALITDVDGTLVPNSRLGMPSVRVIEAIAAAKDFIHVGVATGRQYYEVRPVLKAAGIASPSIVNGGSQVVDHITQEVVWERPLLADDVTQLVEIAKQEKLHDSLLFTTHERYARGVQHGRDNTYYQYELAAVDEHLADTFLEAIGHIPTIAVHKAPSWTAGRFIIIGTHVQGTKQHGIFEVSKHLGIDTKDMIGIGDSGNDFPLLMACGLKVAMGNAMPDLKAIADYIAPSVHDDGLANVIEKYILNELL